MKPLTRTQAIRQKCIDCCCGSIGEVRRCTMEKCALFSYRLGYKHSKQHNTHTDVEQEKTPQKNREF